MPIVVQRQVHLTHIPPVTATKLCLVAKGHPSMKHSSQSVHLFTNGWNRLNKESFRRGKSIFDHLPGVTIVLIYYYFFLAWPKELC